VGAKEINGQTVYSVKVVRAPEAKPIMAHSLPSLSGKRKSNNSADSLATGIFARVDGETNFFLKRASNRTAYGVYQISQHLIRFKYRKYRDISSG
jgi:hypothetical protein